MTSKLFDDVVLLSEVVQVICFSVCLNVLGLYTVSSVVFART